MLIIKEIKNRSKCTKTYIRDSYWSIPDTMDILVKNLKFRYKFITINDKKVRPYSIKNKLYVNTFKKKGKCQCAYCGLVASYMVLETDGAEHGIYCFNLYGYDSINKCEVLFNIDHIQPKAHGGDNTQNNLQLTCQECNIKKSDIWITPYAFKVVTIVDLIYDKIVRLT